MLVAAGLAVAVLATAFLAGRATRRHLPELVSYLVVGALLGPTGAALIHRDEFVHLRPVIQLASAALMFLVGERLSLRAFRAARWVVGGAVASYLSSALAVYVAAVEVGADQGVAVVLATLAGGGAPMTIAAVVARRRSAYPDALVAFHAVCDALASVAFAAALPVVVLLTSPGRTVGGAVLDSLRLGVAGAAVGALGGVSLTALVRRTPGRLLPLVVVGHVAAAGAACLALGLSVPLCGLVLGAVSASRIPAGSLPATFAALTRLEPGLYVLFFTLAGAAIRLDALPRIGAVGLAYVGARTVAKVASGAITARVRGFASGRAFRLGLDALPQAGVAVPLAAVASAALPGRGIATVTLGAIVLFEVVGAALVRVNLDRQPLPALEPGV